MKRSVINEVALKGVKKQKVDSNGIEALGKIDSIHLRNFMCHENFELKFGSRMNFIIGQNGSGKSAILTALILALGGASNLTGRYSNIRGFIKTGKQRAKVEVVLYNCGEAAYKPELYGQKITVARVFTIDGANYYKLKSEAGKVLASTKNELLNVLNAMDIHVNNPVQVLTQEISRTFLLSKHATGEKLYEFFFEGTCLKALEDSYNDVKVNKQESKQLLESKLQALPEMKSELDKWKKFLVSSEKIMEYKNELIWAGVIEMENILKKKEDEYSNVENELKINEREMEKCKVLLDTRTKELDECTKMRMECSAAVSEYRNKVLQLKSRHVTCNTALIKHEGSLASYTRQEKKILNEMRDLENRINEKKQKTQIDLQAEEKKRLDEVQRLQNANQILRGQLDEIPKKKATLMEEQGLARQKMDNLVAEINGLEYNKNKIKQRLNHVQMALKDKVNVFGANTQNVLNEISARKREFKKIPVGPLGMYIEVKDPRWCAAIGKCISKSLLCSYWVDNYDDCRILKDIMRKHCSKMPSTVMCPFSNEMYDVSQHKAQTTFPTVLDMLKFKNIQAANALIDQARIENVILIEDTNTGQNLMLRNPPRNCKSAYIINCDQICLRPYRYYSETNPNRKSLLSSVQKNEITQLNEHLSALAAETETRKDQQRELQKHIETFPAKLKYLDDSTYIRYSMTYQENCDKIKDLNCAKNIDEVYCLEEDLQDLEKEQETKRAAIEACEVEVAKYREEKDEIIREKEEVKELLYGEKAKYDDLVLRSNQYRTDIETLAVGKTSFEKEAKACEKKLQVLLRSLTDKKQKTEEATKNAERICGRIDTENDCDTIRRQLAETQKVVEAQSNCNKNDVAQKYYEKHQRYKEAEKELKRLKSYLTTLDGMLKQRYKKFNKIKTYTRTIVDVTFISILQGNGFTGSLKFDDDNRTLKLKVAKKGRSAKQNHSTLSGGERSFVTIAFLLALWERTNMPFRVLDEYDVFMDSSNRQLSVDLLIRKAEEMANTQFIFLSPLDLPIISHPENVKIHRMVPPTRIES